MIKYWPDVEQGTDEWHALRCGILTASEMKLILTPTLKIASNDRERQHLYELLGQRITQYVEPRYIGDDMLRGDEDEINARIEYSEHYGPVTECGFITNDFLGFTIGYSPDGLVGDDGLIECKSRRQKYQIETIISGRMPDYYTLQCQTGLMVSERKWIDFVSRCAGLPLFVCRLYPDQKIIDAIACAASDFEERIQKAMKKYNDWRDSQTILIETQREIEQEITI